MKTLGVWGQHILFLGIMAFCLSACHTIRHTNRDGPPPFAVDVSRVKDPVPKCEPKSKYGNPKTYCVRGHCYRVMQSSVGYVERGIASWYGTRFHAQKTSNRENYDMLAMTAAHKTLPLPTYLQVTNLQTGQHAIVRVNDRGPFVANRLIDLSYVAAKKIGVTPKGTALVEIRSIDPHHPSYAQPKPQIGAARIYVQVGAFAVHANAEHAAAHLRQKVDLPVLLCEYTKDGQTLYRVRTGPLPNVEAADALNARLVQQGLSKTIIVVQ
jgi:rare lipoprotein A